MDISRGLHGYILMGEGVFHEMIHGKLVNPFADGIDKRNTGTIDNIQRGNLFATRLQEITAGINGNNRPHGQVNINQ
jgi:hypothetical protein